jgi:L-rhamnose mutarotase
MDRLCLLFSIRPGSGEEFDRRHREAWPELIDALQDSGFRNYTLFRREGDVVAYGECEPDAETCFRTLAGHEISRRWNASFVPEIMEEPAVGSAGATLPVTEVWHLP